jgi:DNA-binding CsgD family transcriptional regulator
MDEELCKIKVLKKKRAHRWSQKNDITSRQIECLVKLVKFGSIKEVAQEMDLSDKTVEYHLQMLRWKAKVFTLYQLIAWGFRAGYLTLLMVFLCVSCGSFRASTEIHTTDVRKPLGTVYVYGVPQAGGSVAGGGSYPAQSTIQISAKPNSGWSLQQWNDGNTQLTRLVKVPNPNSSVTYTATFQQNAASTIPITVGWGSVAEAVSYRVYQGRSSGSYTNATGTASTQLQIQVWPGTTYIAVTSVAANNLESTNYSNEITYTY